MQSAVFDVAFNSQKNLLVCAPTGAGKTNVALLCLLELAGRFHLGDDASDESPAERRKAFLADLAQHKAVYVAPLKALAQEVVDKFKERLAPLGMIVKELTGDAQLSKKDADAAHVLVVTPEKWDVVTRKQGGGGGGDSMGSLASRCRLLIVDEIHLLAEERGAVLECVVARTTRLVESSQSQARLVGLSATLPNYEDVGSFLGCADDSVFFFGPEFRPVPLKQTFVGVTETKRFQKLVKLDDLAFDVALSAVDRGHQAMIFVHSRRETFKTAMALRDRANRDGRDGAFKPAEELGNLLKPFAPALAKCKHKELREAAEAGFGLHHAGMCRADRSLSERMFAAGAVRVLCCTATLAWGVNLPAHAVICKGTDVYDPQRGGHVDLSMLDVLQIFGRAGRPQFDDFGEATLLTTQKALPDYLRKLARAAPIESCLPARLADAINAEVAAGTVASLKDAGRWLDHTFLAGQDKGDSTSLQRECSARARSGKSIHASRPFREMIARPKISRIEWKMAEIGAFEVGNFALLCCPAVGRGDERARAPAPPVAGAQGPRWLAALARQAPPAGPRARAVGGREHRRGARHGRRRRVERTRRRDVVVDERRRDRAAMQHGSAALGAAAARLEKRALAAARQLGFNPVQVGRRERCPECARLGRRRPAPRRRVQRGAVGEAKRHYSSPASASSPRRAASPSWRRRMRGRNSSSASSSASTSAASAASRRAAVASAAVRIMNARLKWSRGSGSTPMANSRSSMAPRRSPPARRSLARFVKNATDRARSSAGSRR